MFFINLFFCLLALYRCVRENVAVFLLNSVKI